MHKQNCGVGNNGIAGGIFIIVKDASTRNLKDLKCSYSLQCAEGERESRWAFWAFLRTSYLRMKFRYFHRYASQYHHHVDNNVEVSIEQVQEGSPQARTIFNTATTIRTIHRSSMKDPQNKFSVQRMSSFIRYCHLTHLHILRCHILSICLPKRYGDPMYYQEDFDGRPKQIEQVGYEKEECM